jgi:hypothetical protein
MDLAVHNLVAGRIELINGVGHPLWSLWEMRYTPGLATAPVLLALAIVLARLARDNSPSSR